MLVIILLLLILIILMYNYYVHYTKNGQLINLIPGQLGYPIIGNTLHFLGSREEQWKKIVTLTNQYVIFKVWIFFIPFVSITDPDDVEKILSNTNHVEKSIVYDIAKPWLGTSLGISKDMDNEEYQKFTERGYFTIRRTNKFWTGIWSDMMIEQTLMRSKTTGGLIRGRGVTDSVLGKWILGMPPAHNVTEQLERFCKLSLDNCEQHVEMRDMARDDTDLQRLLQWLESHKSFPTTKEIMSIATGVTGDETINCHDAYCVGKQAMQQMIGQNFEEVKLKRNDSKTNCPYQVRIKTR
ncbi:Cytochrome P450 4C1 [Trachymyrmex cornetzi]|uniref:Cytochrome P450 4C1 n=1 Tax=Trachymyrmex cornetzi TaxID=471704 RepID=A0A151J7L3_9HYME|nr:Cytochrome P450 4C1 [Trachymyrmex cornetzi]